MNTNFGLIGIKLGNTQVFGKDGNVKRVTAIRVGPSLVLGKRSEDKEGYSALIVGFGERRDKLVNKPEAGLYRKIDQKPARKVREFRLPAEKLSEFAVGQHLKPSEHFRVGQKVDVTGISKGRGYTGVMKRWNFAGAGSASHGTHEYKRHGGSIGTNLTPGRTLANLKMAGQYGNETVTILNLEIAEVLDEEWMLLVEGAVPGPRNGFVTVRGAVKAKPA
ncbi:MAG: 50S ribosomal protein L3 [Proteobacteria bacterium]|nr:50S ribosomal protein L3 [Pseudomonadota bacterium]